MAKTASRLPRSALIAGERVFLRRPTARDSRAFTAAVRASRDLHRPYVSPPADARNFSAYLGRLRRSSHAGFLVCSRETREFSGVININEIVHGAFQSGYLGYYALEPSAGSGDMSEGLELVVSHAFARMGLHRLEANIQPDNRRSIGLVRRCGFCREGLSPRYLKVAGRWRDHERWAIVAEDWCERRKSS